MKYKKYSKAPQKDYFTNLISKLKYLTLTFLVFGATACTDFVEVDPPENTLISETVFEDASTVKAALADIYYKLREQGMVSGNFGLNILMGSYSDELDYLGSTVEHLEFYGHTIPASNNTILNWWGHTYNLIYAANDIIKGVDNSTALSVEDQEKFKGQALFVRAYLHSLLVGIYGDIPYITTTNYLENNTISRMPESEVYQNIIADLTEAVSLLDDTDTTGERVIPNQSAANALLARIYLYTENWELAGATANKLISAYSLESDITKVFLKDSPETLWQFKPNGTTHNNTYEANWIITTLIGDVYTLSNNILAAFEPDDLRRTNWVGSYTDGGTSTTLLYAHKYKARFTETTPLEYSIIFRLSEQYLIRAEARAHQGDIAGAQQDLNVIRNRAGLGDTTAAIMSDLLDVILQERRVELFTEHGQRWFDLKRTKKASEILSPIKPNWQDTDTLFPIPENELEVNPNLKPQNDGY